MIELHAIHGEGSMSCSQDVVEFLASLVIYGDREAIPLIALFSSFSTQRLIFDLDSYVLS